MKLKVTMTTNVGKKANTTTADARSLRDFATVLFSAGNPALYAIPTAVFPAWNDQTSSIDYAPSFYSSKDTDEQTNGHAGIKPRTRQALVLHERDARVRELLSRGLRTAGSEPDTTTYDSAVGESHADTRHKRESLRTSKRESFRGPHSKQASKLLTTESNGTMASSKRSRSPNDEFINVSPRPRSRAIAITRKIAPLKTSESSGSEEDYSVSADDRMYDWATWRLYHRIMEHRQKHPLTQSYYEVSSPSLDESRMDRSGRSSDDSPTLSHIRLPPPVDTDILDGEVFELEI
jgi:hypothetical protein